MTLASVLEPCTVLCLLYLPVIFLLSHCNKKCEPVPAPARCCRRCWHNQLRYYSLDVQPAISNRAYSTLVLSAASGARLSKGGRPEVRRPWMHSSPMDGAHPVPQCLAPNAPEAEANGLLARLLRARLAGTSGGSASDGGGGTGSNAALSWRSAGSDLEEPLLAAEAGEAGEPQQEQQRELQQPPPPKRWPQLRRGSISTRRRSPVPPATPAEESPFLASAFLPGAAAPQDLGGKAAAAAAAGGVKGEAVPGHRGGLGLALSAGLVNSIISLPIMLSFAAIIFRVGG